MRRIPFLICFAAFALACPAHSEDLALKLTQYGHTAWRTQDGLFDGTPTAVTQTADGYLWIATTSGLVRFDGMRFFEQAVPSPDSPGKREVDAVYGAKDGSLWLGTERELIQWKDGRYKYFTQPATRGHFNQITEDRRSDILAVRSRVPESSGPLCRLSAGTMRCFGKADGLPCQTAGALAQDQSGSVWIGSPQGLCSWSNSGSSVYLPNHASATDESAIVQALEVSPGMPVLVGFKVTGPGLGLATFQQGEFGSFNVPGLVGSEQSVGAILRDSQGDLWVGTSGKGLYHVSHGRADHFGSGEGLSGDSVQNLYEDREGNVWITTTEGIDRFRPNAVSTLTTKEGLTSGHTVSVVRAPDGMIFAGEGGLSILRGGSSSAHPLLTPFRGFITTSLLVDHTGALWFGLDSGLWCLRNGERREWRTVDGHPSAMVLSIAEDTSNVIWLVSTYHTHTRLFRVEGDHLQPVATPGFDMGDQQVVADPVNGIWVQSKDGNLRHYRDGKFELVTGGGADFDFYRFTVADDGSVWGMGGRGLVILQKGHWTRIDSHNGLPCDRVDALIKDRHGSLWLSTECGLAVIDRAELARWSASPGMREPIKLAHFFDAADGARSVRSPFSPTTALGPDGRLWFADSTLLRTVDPEHLPINTIQPPVHVEQVVADHRQYPLNASLTLPALTRDVNIDYSALSLVAPHKVRFRYKLSGVDRDWQDVGGRRQAFFMNLRPGRYVFQVVACNNDGYWNSAGDSLTFVIPPVFYQTNWFLVVVFALSLALLWLIFQLRLRAATNLMESRYGERLMERDRIARELHDTLLQSIQGLILRLDVTRARIPETLPSRTMLEVAIVQAEEVLLEGRDRVRDLRSRHSGKNYVVEELHRLIEGLRESHGPALRLVVTGEPRPIKVIVAEELLSFAKEALSNAVRHSQATDIVADIRYTAKSLVFVAADNGVGIPSEILTANGKPGHWGLIGLQERAVKMGATKAIRSDALGTRIELKVPARVAFLRPSDRYLAIIRYLTSLRTGE